MKGVRRALNTWLPRRRMPKILETSGVTFWSKIGARAAATVAGETPGAKRTYANPSWLIQLCRTLSGIGFAREVVGMKASPTSWVLCGKSRATPVTRSEICGHAVAPPVQLPTATVRVRPMGSASPKYVLAADWDRTTDSGWRNTEPAHP